MIEWFKSINITVAAVVAVLIAATGGVTVGAALDGWMGVPGTIGIFGDSLASTATIVAQNRRSVTQLRETDISILSTLRDIEETVRIIDRRTCIAAADTEAERQDCAVR